MHLREKNKKLKKNLSESEVLEFLVENPSIINNNIDLFNEMFFF